MAKETRDGRRISEALLDELLAGQDPAQVFRDGNLIDDLKKAVAERALDAEMDAHLEGERDAENRRNGHNRKRVLTDDSALDLEVPRDRAGRFEPQLVEKYARRLPGFDDKLISMYARGMTTREIRGHVAEIYGVTVSAELISKVTDAVLEEVAEWQSRPLEEADDVVPVRRPLREDRDQTLVNLLDRQHRRKRHLRPPAAVSAGHRPGSEWRLHRHWYEHSACRQGSSRKRCSSLVRRPLGGPTR